VTSVNRILSVTASVKKVNWIGNSNIINSNTSYIKTYFPDPCLIFLIRVHNLHESIHGWMRKWTSRYCVKWLGHLKEPLMGRWDRAQDKWCLAPGLWLGNKSFTRTWVTSGRSNLLFNTSRYVCSTFLTRVRNRKLSSHIVSVNVGFV